MCICINCKWVDRCVTYHDVENNHGVDNICDVPNFKALKPYIHVSIVKDNNGHYKTDWDVQSCRSLQKVLRDSLTFCNICEVLQKSPDLRLLIYNL